MEDAYDIRELLRSWNDKHTRRRVGNEETMMERKEVMKRGRNKLRSEVFIGKAR